MIDGTMNFDTSELTSEELSELIETFRLCIPEHLPSEGSSSAEEANTAVKPAPIQQESPESSESDREVTKNNKRLAKALAKAFGELDAESYKTSHEKLTDTVPCDFKENDIDFQKHYYLSHTLKKHRIEQEKEDKVNREVECFYNTPRKQMSL